MGVTAMSYITTMRVVDITKPFVMRNITLIVTVFAFTFLISPESFASCSYDLNGVGYGDNCPYRGNASGGNNTNNQPQYYAPPVDNSAEIERQRAEAEAAAAEAERQAQQDAERQQRALDHQAEALRRVQKETEHQAQFIRDRNDAVSTLHGLGDATSSQLKGLADTHASILKDGSGTAGGQSAEAKKYCPTVTDSNVVDACSAVLWGSELPKVAEIENSPAAGKARKGLQAVSNHDWPVALAWWQDALHDDPNNAALKRSVDMAQWVLAWRKKYADARTPVEPVLNAIDRGDLAAAQKALDTIQTAHPELKNEIVNMSGFMNQHHDDYMVKLGNATSPPLDTDFFDKLHEAHMNDFIDQAEKEFKHSLSDELFDQAMLQIALGNSKTGEALLNRAMHSDEEGQHLSSSSEIHN